MSRTYVIYKIKSLDPTVDYCYVGSTQNFTKRKCQHKSRCNLINTKLYNTMRENGGWLNFEMTPIEEYKCDTPQQAHIREQYWIENIEENKLNSKKAFISGEQKIEYQKEYQKEYKAVNKDITAKYNKEYYAVNKDRLDEKIKQYKAINKKHIAEQKKEYNKEYREKNREQIKKYQDEYREKKRMLKE